MMEETTPRTSAGWKPHSTFAEEMGVNYNDKVANEATVTQVEV
jgi:hypothetical protein